MYTRITGLFVVSLITLGIISSCSDDNNIVGSTFIPSDRNIIVDTLDITNLTIEELVTFTGNLTYFSAGKYQDQVYGEVKSTSFLAPGISTLSPADSMEAGAEVYLVLEPFNFYGDTTSTAVFDLHYITERWRPNDANVNSQFSTDPVSIGSIEITAETDSVLFQLPQQWADNFRGFFNETENPIENLRANEFGFALVPRDDNNVIVGFRTESLQQDTLGNSFYSGSRLFVVNPEGSDDDDNGDDNGNGNGESSTMDNGNGDFVDPFPGRNTFSVLLRGSAFNIQRENTDYEGTSLPLLNTFEQNLVLEMDLEGRGLLDQVISRAEILLFDDLEAIENLPENHFRPKSGRLQYYTLNDTERQFEVVKLPVFEPQFREGDNSYRVNVTSFIQNFQTGQSTQTRFYITSGNNNGLILPAILAGPESGERSPKLIITRINPEN